MATSTTSKRAIITISDHNDGDTCSLYYSIRYKPASDSVWVTLTQQQPELYGSPATYVLFLDNLQEDILYDYEITRYCCGGNISVAATGTFTSTDT